MSDKFRTVTELATGPAGPGVPSHCRRCGRDLYFVQCGLEGHIRCLNCNMCFHPDWMFGLMPLYHTGSGSAFVPWDWPADWAGDEPPGGCRPGVLPTSEEVAAKVAAGVEAVIRERYGD